MKNVLICVIVIAAFSGCAQNILPEVTFEYFNLSTNEIWVTDVVGLPPDATPGRLMPRRGENQLEVSASVFNESVRIKREIRILWKDNGKQGWPGGLKQVPLQPPTVPPGTAHEAVFKREDLGIPSKLIHAKIRFTYLGQDKWRIKIYGPTTTFEGIDKVKDFSPPYKP